jgi:hypothetical protein
MLFLKCSIIVTIKELKKKVVKKFAKKIVKKMSNNCQKVVKKLSKRCQKVFKKLTKSCQKNKSETGRRRRRFVAPRPGTTLSHLVKSSKWLYMAQTKFYHSKPFKSGQNRLPLFQAIPVRPKPISSITSLSSPAKIKYTYCETDVTHLYVF